MKSTEFFACSTMLTISLFLCTACSDPVSSIPDISADVLLSAPETLNVENQQIILTTEMWRDFQPVSPPEGKPLIIIASIQTVDSSAITSVISPEHIYIVNEDDVWKSEFTEEENPPGSESFKIVKVARGGPAWGPGIYVDAIVRIRVNTEVYLLRASDQYIARTD